MVFLAGCGGTTAAVDSAPGSAPGVEVASSGYAVAYGGASVPVEPTADEAAMIARLEGDGPLGCAIDPRLVRAARRQAAALAASTRSQGEAEMDHLRFAVLAEGGTDYLLTPFVVRDLGGGQAALAAFVAEHRREITHCGVGAARADGRGVAVWVGSRRAVAVEPLPVASAVGAVLTVSGRTSGAEAAVRAFLGLPDGSAIALAPRAGGGGAFTVAVPLAQAGRYELEIQVDLGGGPETALLLPLFAGTPPDARPTVAAAEADAGQPAGEPPDSQLFALVNAVRRKLGVEPLTRDGRLDRVASAHSADMVALGYFGHRSPSGAMLADRLRASGLRPSVVGENVARSSSASRVHRNLMASPSHRMELLSRAYTHMGVGVARDGEDLVVTEVLARW